MHRRAGDGERIDFFIACTDWIGEIENWEPEKCDELRWSPIHTLPANTTPYIGAAIATWRDGSWFSTFGWKPMP